MIVDTSALVAILADEPEREAFLELIVAAGSAEISTATYVETAAVLDRCGDPALSRRLDELLEALDITLVPVSAEQAQAARAAYRDFGRGSGHRASLNFGDVFSYALATTARQPLLFKGDDFGHTDVQTVSP